MKVINSKKNPKYWFYFKPYYTKKFQRKLQVWILDKILQQNNDYRRSGLNTWLKYSQFPCTLKLSDVSPVYKKSSDNKYRQSKSS